LPQGFLLVLGKVLHVQVAGTFEPVLVHLDPNARTSRKQLSALGKMRTTWVRRLISWLRRSSMLVDFMCLWWASGSR
jgi:hypothetical protein